MFLTIEEFNAQLKGVKINARKLKLNFMGVDVTINNKLYFSVFRRTKGTVCACCGKEAVGYMLEKSTYTWKGNGECPKLSPFVRLFGYNPDGSKFFFNMDHIIPRSRGGRKADMNNLQTHCIECNTAKGNLLPSEQIMGTGWLRKIAINIMKNEPDLYLL